LPSFKTRRFPVCIVDAWRGRRDIARPRFQASVSRNYIFRLFFSEPIEY